MILVSSLLLAVLCAAPAAAAELPDTRPGWVIERTEQGYAELIENVDGAVAASPLNVVTRASATVGAKSLGQDIPGNMVVGVFAPEFAIRLLEASLAAGIEAPLRLYITENPDGTATLSYKAAAHVLAPYAEEGGQALTALATELDTVLEQIADQATRQRN
jgi:uncharacterized protein (DUF302 family)